MTTTIIVLAGLWPIQITAIDHRAETPDSAAFSTEHELALVQPGGHHMAHVSDSRELRITELPLPPVGAALAEDDALIDPGTIAQEDALILTDAERLSTLDANPPGLAFGNAELDGGAPNDGDPNKRGYSPR